MTRPIQEPHEWPDHEHDDFIRLAQTVDTFDELRAHFPHRTESEVMKKAAAMGVLGALIDDWDLHCECRAEGLIH
jgi:hypothetical protein